MLYQEVLSGIVSGVEGQLIHVEIEIRNGLPYFIMVGYLSKEAAEAKERVASAMRSIGHPLPSMRITVNLSPANIRKKGTAFDFPIAVAFLACLGLIPASELKDICVLGELGLNGRIHGTRNCLPIVLEAKKQGIRRFFIAAEDQDSVDAIEGIEIILMNRLSDVLEYFQGRKPRMLRRKRLGESVPEAEDFYDMKGQEHLKRAIEIAVTGRHHLLLIGSPGSGKTMAIKRIPSILYPLTDRERFEVQSIYDASGIPRKIADPRRPFREPHSSIPFTALLGGGRDPRAGEITLAHRGILVLDELMEFRRECLDALRQPLEEKQIQMSRLDRNYVFPADFQLIAAMNPCPCGFALEDGKCRCSLAQKQRYLHKLSGPLLDRFDMVLTVREESEDLRGTRETSKAIRERIRNNVALEHQALAGTGYSFFSEIKQRDIEKIGKIADEGMEFLQKAYDLKKITKRGADKILRLAMTIALIDETDEILLPHIAEAMTFRNTEFVREG